MAKATKKQVLGRGLSALLKDPSNDIKSVDDIKSVNNIKSVDDIKSINDISVKSKISENYNLSDIIKRTKLLEDEVNTIKRLLKNLSENL